MTEEIGDTKGERETRLSAPQQLLQQFADHPGWQTAVACAAGSDTCVRPELLDLRATAKPHGPLRDLAQKPPIGRRDANGRIIALLCPPANLAIAVCVGEEFSYMS